MREKVERGECMQRVRYEEEIQKGITDGLAVLFVPAALDRSVPIACCLCAIRLGKPL